VGSPSLDELWFVGDGARVLTRGVSRVEKMVTYLAVCSGFCGDGYQWTVLRSALQVFDHGLLNIRVIGEPTPPNIGTDNNRLRKGVWVSG